MHKVQHLQLSLFLYNIIVVPTPDVTIELSNSLAVPYEATQQTLTCTVSPISPLPNPLFIDIQWSMDNKPLDTDGVRLNISTVDEYISTLSFSPAGIFDSGEYRCFVVISTNNPNIVNATESYTYNFTIQGKCSNIMYLSILNELHKLSIFRSLLLLLL